MNPAGAGDDRKEGLGSNLPPTIDFRLRPPLRSWQDKPQFRRDLPYSGTRIGFPRPPSAEHLSVELLMEEMDTAVIRWGVIMGRQSAPPLGIIPNEEIAEFLSEHPDRFVAFAGVDIADPTVALVETEKWLRDGRFCGISIEPCCSATPMMANDSRLRPIFAICSEARVPISVGLSYYLCNVTGNDYRYGSPLPLTDVAAEFPKLPIVVSHAAWPCITDMLTVALMCPNVFVSPDLYLTPKGMPGSADLVAATGFFLSNRLLFGTAYPSRPLVETVVSARNLGWPEGVLERVMFGNAAALLNLAP